MSSHPPNPDQRLSVEFVILREAVPVFLQVSEHLKKSNDNQVLLISEVASTRAELARNSRRMAIMTAALVAMFLLLLVQSVRLEYTLSSVSSAHKSIQQTSFQLADVQKSQAEGAKLLNEAAQNISRTRESLEKVSSTLPQIQVDGFGRTVIRVRLDEKASKALSQTTHGKVSGVTPDSEWATLPIVNGRIQYQ